MNLIYQLKKIGLNEKEAKVYLALLQLGRTTAHVVSKKSGIKNSTTYVILEQLVEKGFVFEIPRVKKRLYIAQSPEKCIFQIEESIQEVKESLPELLAMKKTKREKVSVSYYEGISGIEEATEKMFAILKKKPSDERSIVSFYAKENSGQETLNKIYAQFNENARKLRVKRKAITVFDDSIKNKYLNKEFIEKHSIHFRAISPKKYNSNISIDIYENYVQIFSHRNLQAVVIEDGDVSKAMRQIFQMNWELLVFDKKNFLFFDSQEVAN